MIDRAGITAFKSACASLEEPLASVAAAVLAAALKMAAKSRVVTGEEFLWDAFTEAARAPFDPARSTSFAAYAWTRARTGIAFARRRHLGLYWRPDKGWVARAGADVASLEFYFDSHDASRAPYDGVFTRDGGLLKETSQAPRPRPSIDRAAVDRLLSSLDRVERWVVERCVVDDESLVEAGRELGLTRQSVHQIFSRAILKLRRLASASGLSPSLARRLLKAPAQEK